MHFANTSVKINVFRSNIYKTNIALRKLKDLCRLSLISPHYSSNYISRVGNFSVMKTINNKTDTDRI